MSFESVEIEKQLIKSRVSVVDVLNRYGIEVSRGRCRGFCHTNRSSDTIKVFDDYLFCFRCNKRYDIFDLVCFFENCDFMQALALLKGDEVMPPNVLSQFRISQIKRNEFKRLLEIEKQKLANSNKKLTVLREIYRKEEEKAKKTRVLSEIWAIARQMYYRELLTQENQCNKINDINTTHERGKGFEH